MLRLCPNENNKSNKESSRSVNEIEKANRTSVLKNIDIFKLTINNVCKEKCFVHRPTFTPETIHLHITKIKNCLVMNRHSHLSETIHTAKEMIFSHGSTCTQPESNAFTHIRKNVCFLITTDIYCNHTHTHTQAKQRYGHQTNNYVINYPLGLI